MNNTPIRGFRIPENEYGPAMVIAGLKGESLTGVVRRAIRSYVKRNGGSPANQCGQSLHDSAYIPCRRAAAWVLATRTGREFEEGGIAPSYSCDEHLSTRHSAIPEAVVLPVLTAPEEVSSKE